MQGTGHRPWGQGDLGVEAGAVQLTPRCARTRHRPSWQRPCYLAPRRAAPPGPTRSRTCKAGRWYDGREQGSLAWWAREYTHI